MLCVNCSQKLGMCQGLFVRTVRGQPSAIGDLLQGLTVYLSESGFVGFKDLQDERFALLGTP